MLRLDNNEGSWVSDQDARRFSESPPATLRNYPSASFLEQAIAGRCGVRADQVLVTAGADDAIDRCFRVFLGSNTELILTAPTFQQFHRFAASTPTVVREVPWVADFPRDEVVRTITPNTAMVAYATPNNPTGLTASADDLKALSAALPGGWVMLDHAYVEYADEDLTSLAVTLPNVVVIRTFSKAWGMAGCRVGYLIAPEGAVRKMRAVGNPYPVSGVSLSIVAQRYAESGEEVADHVTRVRVEREAIKNLLERHQVPVPASSANFLFPHFGDRTDFVRSALAARDIVVREFPDRAELREGLRISLPDDGASLAGLTSALTLALDPQALLFDMDGVLADTRQSYTRCTIETAQHFGADVTAAEVEAVVCSGEANNDWIVVQRLLAKHGIGVGLDTIRDRFQLLYHGSAAAGSPPGHKMLETATVRAGELRTIAGKRGIGIVTGRPRAEAVEFLARFNLKDDVDAMVCMEEGPLKPDPWPVARVMRRLGVTSAWMIGDTPDDINAAESAGILGIGMTTDTGPRAASLVQTGAVAVIPNIQSLKRFLP